MNLTFVVSKSLSEVFDYLTDMQKFASVHPVISKIDKRSETNYLVHETLKVASIPFSFTYPVALVVDKEKNCIQMKATVMKVTEIAMKFTLHLVDGKTIVNEQVVFKSIFPLKTIMERIFKTQHTILFRNINDL